MGPSHVTFTPPNAAVTTARFEQGGSYVLRLSATDGRATGFDDVVVTVLPAPAGPPPVVEIASPEERAAVTDFTDVIGTVRSDALLSWRLEYRKQGTTAFTPFAPGTTPVENGVLGTLDPRLLKKSVDPENLLTMYVGRLKDPDRRFVIASRHVELDSRRHHRPRASSFADHDVGGPRELRVAGSRSNHPLRRGPASIR
jgi:hypothetical protein